MNSIAHHTQPVIVYNDPFEVLSAVNLNRHTTLCHLLVLQDAEKTLVIATELHRNNGFSITNASEKLATEVVTRFRLDPTSMTVLEHYDDVMSYGYRGIPTHYPDHYKRVEYTWETVNVPDRIKLIDLSEMSYGTEMGSMTGMTSHTEHRASRPSWSDFLPYAHVLSLLGSRVSDVSQMAALSTEDYEFIGVLAPQEGETQKQQWVILPDKIVPGIDGPDMHVPSYALPFVKSHTYTPFIYGVSRRLSWETVNAALVMKTRGVTFYCVRRAFEVSL